VRKTIIATLIALSSLAIPSTAEAKAGSCPQYNGLLAQYHLPVGTFSRIMWRESNCRPHVRSRTHDSGLLQINDVNLRWLSKRLGFRVTSGWLMNADNNVHAASLIYRSYGLRPWRA
jgi:soluble lytic murein transglycosylase-like protein